MPTSQAPDALRRFIDDELLRAPLVVESVIDAAFADMRNDWSLLSPSDRAAAMQLQHDAQTRRSQAVQHFVQSLREQALDELQRFSKAPKPARAPRAAPVLALAPAGGTLALLDDATVASDVELSQLIEAVHQHAEHELRELATYIAALIGDMGVTRDHNPFRPDNFARAMWAATQAFPSALGFRVAFLRHARTPLAKVLRKNYAGACSRLEAGGVQPAAHRTVIVNSGSRGLRPGDSGQGVAPDLHLIGNQPAQPSAATAAAPSAGLEFVLGAAERALQDLPADAAPARMGSLIETWRTKLVEGAPSTADLRTIDVVSQLFVKMITECHLAAGVPRLVASLLVPALRTCLRNDTVLPDHGHPMWRFMDRLAFLGDMLTEAGAAEREAQRNFAQSVVRQVAGERQPDAAIFRWGHDRLQAWSRHRLELLRQPVQKQFADLEALERELLDTQDAPQTATATLDEAGLDTVPAVLMESLPARTSEGSDDAAPWVAERCPGDWLRVFTHGRWQRAQLVWLSPRGELALLIEVASGSSLAVHRGALERLYDEHLLMLLLPLSLVTLATGRIKRDVERSRAA